MEDLNGKYFENVIAALNQLKTEEQINIDMKLKDNLRLQLINKIRIGEFNKVNNDFDWAKFLNKWKYLFGLVPTMAVLAFVAVNLANYQLNLKSVEYADTFQQSANLKTDNSNQIADLASSQKQIEQPIKTFSAELALSPEILAKLKNQETINNNLENSVNVSAEQKNSNLLLATNLSNAKPVQPKLKTVSFEAKKLEINLSTANSVKSPAVSTDNRQINSATVNLPVLNNASNITVPEHPLNQNTVQEQINLNTRIVDTKTELNLNSEPLVNSIPLNTAQTIAPVAKEILAVSRIRYSGRDATQVYQAVMNSFADLSGHLSSDYYIEVKSLESGTLQASLFEYGKIKKIIFLKRVDGKIQKFTEINY